jgi:hypothetical protein
MALPKRAASALAAVGEMPDHRHQARTQAGPRPEEVYEVNRPHVRDSGSVAHEPVGEEEEPHAEDDEGGVEAAAGPFFTGAVHGGVSLADVANPGTKSTEAPTSPPVPPPP